MPTSYSGTDIEVFLETQRNVSWANVAIEFSEVGTQLTLETLGGSLDAILCKATWINSEKNFRPWIRHYLAVSEGC